MDGETAMTGGARRSSPCQPGRTDGAPGRERRARAEQTPVRRPLLSLRLGPRGRRAIVIRIDGGERVMLAPVTAAAMLSGSILCAADVPPTIAGLPVAGYALLATAVWLLKRLIAAT
jgi:hypothetical protein